MKLICLAAFVFMLNSVHAQQIFQGSIVYNLHTPKEKDVELTIFYGPNKIKIKYKEKEDYDKTYLLIDLDSGKFFTVNTEGKTFQSKKLAETNKEINASPKIIAGHSTTPVKVNSSGLGGLFGFSGTFVLYTAPDLYFPVPSKHAAIPELLMIQDDHIVLGAEIKMGFPGMSDETPDSLSNQMKISVEAVKVNPQSFEIAEFSIPNDFTRQSNNSFTMTDTVDVIADTTMMLDTLAVPPPVKKNSKPAPKPSTPKTKPTKTEAIKPKKTQITS